MWRELTKIMNDATAKGLSKGEFSIDHNRVFLDAVKHANEIFAAFKTHAMGKSMASKLLDDNGNLKPFDKWMKDISSISSHHVGSWLKTEYNTAVLRAHNAADWRSFIENKDIMPNLRWMPTTSPDAEAVHRGYWEKKLTLPVEHPFWNKHHPGDRWNCKCSLESTDDPASPDDVLDDLPIEPAQRGLENNPGKDGKMFNDTHPYFPKNCNQCSFYKDRGLKNKVKTWFSNHEKDCYNCSFFNNKEEEQKRRNSIKEFIENVLNSPWGGKKGVYLGEISNEEVKALKEIGVKLKVPSIHIVDVDLKHATRPEKIKEGIAVSVQGFKNFVQNYDNPKMFEVYWDAEKVSLLYLTKYENQYQKFIVKINGSGIKCNREILDTNYLRTASLVRDPKNIRKDPKLKKIR
nr:MAG TPA: minor capsid component [Caudoviricetes sp.]